MLAVQAGQTAPEVDGSFAVVESGSDLQEPLLAAGQGTDLGGDGVEVDPLPGRGRVDPWPTGVGELAVEAADQQLGGGLQPVDALAHARSWARCSLPLQRPVDTVDVGSSGS